MLTPEEITTLQTKIDELNAQFKQLDQERTELFEQNKGPVLERNTAQSKKKWFMIGAIIALVLTLWNPLGGGIVGAILFRLLFAAGAAACGYMYYKYHKQDVELSVTLADYDQKVAKIRQTLSQINSECNGYRLQLEENKILEVLSQYEQGYICTYICHTYGKDGKISDDPDTFLPITYSKSQYDLSNLQEMIEHRRKVNQEAQELLQRSHIFLDGQPKTIGQEPFAPLAVEPGTYEISMEACIKNFMYQSGNVAAVESEPISVTVEDKTKFVLFVWQFYAIEGKIHDNLMVQQFDDPMEFLKAGGQYKRCKEQKSFFRSQLKDLKLPEELDLEPYKKSWEVWSL